MVRVILYLLRIFKTEYTGFTIGKKYKNYAVNRN